MTSFMDGSLRQSLVSRDVKCVSKKIKAVEGKISKFNTSTIFFLKVVLKRIYQIQIQVLIAENYKYT